MVQVACHSVYTGLGLQEGAAEEKSSWFLLDYQKVRGNCHSTSEYTAVYGTVQMRAANRWRHPA